MNHVLIGVMPLIQAIASTSEVRHEAIVDAPLAEVWAAFTTKEGVESWMVAHGEVDLRVGGKMRTHYDPKGTLGDPNTIENTILSFEPMRMLSIKATKPPENFPFKKAIESMWSVVYFDELGPERTRVTCVGMGYGDDEESRKLREHFANRKTPASVEEGERLLRSLVGEWTLDHRLPDGGVLRGRMVAREIMDGEFVLSESWLGGEGELKPHGHAIFGRDPVGGGLRVWDFGDGGKVSGAPITVADGNKLLYDWTMHTLDGKTKRFFIDDTLEDSDSLRFAIYELKPGDPRGQKPADAKPMVGAVWKRTRATAAAPESAGHSPQVRVSDKRIDKEVVVAAPIRDVWNAWTTSEGIKGFFAPASKIEMKVGGSYDIYFMPDAPAGSRGAEDCHVLSFLPMEMLAFTWSAPPQWPEIRKERTSVVLRFEDLGDKRVRVKLAHVGFGEGAEWDEVQKYFESAWGVVLQRLEQRFAQASTGPAAHTASASPK